jgi:hypothetical protein
MWLYFSSRFISGMFRNIKAFDALMPVCMAVILVRKR